MNSGFHLNTNFCRLLFNYSEQLALAMSQKTRECRRSSENNEARRPKLFLNGIKTFQARGGGAHSTMDSILASHPVAPSLILGVPKKFSLDVAEIY